MKFFARRWEQFLAFRVSSAAAPALVWRRDLKPLAGFLALGRNFDPRGALAFARAWGPLGLCQHNRFPAHGRIAAGGLDADASLAGGQTDFTTGLEPFEVAPAKCPTRKVPIGGERWTVEPLDAWRDLGAGFAALFDTVLALRHNQRPHAAALKTLDLLRYGLGAARKHYAELDADPDVGARRSRRKTWEMVAERLNEWLVDAPLRFRCEVSAGGNIRTDFVVGDDRGVFPVLAAQLLARISDPERGEAVICSSCHLPFLQTRTPPAGRRRYCLTCRETGAPIRDAARDYYRRRLKQRRLANPKAKEE